MFLNYDTNMVFQDGCISDRRFVLHSRTKGLPLLDYQISGSLFLYLCHCIVYVFAYDFPFLFQQYSNIFSNVFLEFLEKLNT